MSQNNETLKFKNLTEAENRKLNNLLNNDETELSNADEAMIIKLFEKSGEFDTKTLDNLKDDAEGFTDIIEPQDVRSGTPPSSSSSSSISDGARRNAKPARILFAGDAATLFDSPSDEITNSRSKSNRELAVLIAGDDPELLAEVNKKTRLTRPFIKSITKKRAELDKAKRVAELQIKNTPTKNLIEKSKKQLEKAKQTTNELREGMEEFKNARRGTKIKK